MTVSADEILSRLPEKRQRKIAERREELLAEYQTIQDIRKACLLTQEQLAKTLQIKQANVSQIEKRTDLLISTLRGYIEAMGGDLHLIAEFPGRPAVFIDGFSADDEHTTQSRDMGTTAQKKMDKTKKPNMF